MATEQNTGGGRIYKSTPAESTYQGSAQSIGFNPVQAINTERADRQRRNRVLQDADTRLRELRREQAATTASLRAQQQADAGMLRLESSRERAVLEIQQRYDTATLKQRQNYEAAKVDLQGTYLDVKQSLDRQKLQTATSFFNDLLDFAGSMAKLQVEAKENGDLRNLVEAAFGLENNPDNPRIQQAQELDSAINESGIAAETAIQEIDNPIAQQTVREEISQSTIERQQKRDIAYMAATDWPIFQQSWVNDTSVIYTRADGSQFTVATMKVGDIAQVDEASRRAFYEAAGLANMPLSQVAKVVLPKILDTSQKWVLETQKTILQGEQAQAVFRAQQGIRTALSNGENVQTVFSNGKTELFKSGSYVGKLGVAAKDATQEILDYAVSIARENPVLAEDIIKELAKTTKMPNGERLERQFTKEFQAARDEVKKVVVNDLTLEKNFADAQVKAYDRELNLALSETTDPNEERELNILYAGKMSSLGTYEGRKRAKEILAEREYSPFTIYEILDAQENGENFSQERLQAFVNSKNIKPKEAELAGWDKAGGISADTARANKVKGFEKLAKNQARAILTEKIKGKKLSQKSTDRADFIRLQLDGDGSAYIDQLADYILDELNLELRSDPDMDDKLIRQWMVDRRDELKDLVEYKDGEGFTFNWGEDLYPNDMRGNSIDEFQKFAADNKDFDLNSARLLTQRQLATASIAIQNGKPIPDDIEAIASTFGTNAETLLKGQYALYDVPYPSLDSNSNNDFSVTTPTASSSNPELAQYDSGLVIGGISVDALRNAVLGKESGYNFSIVNPHSGAIGVGQVMPENVGPWTKAAIGRAVGTREFRRSPDIQMAVINDRFRRMVNDQYNAGFRGDILVRRVASTWYSGQPNLYDNTRTQYTKGNPYPSIDSYTKDILRRYRAN